jgi:RNA polymerase sigma factor (sigma-70 family)
MKKSSSTAPHKVKNSNERIEHLVTLASQGDTKALAQLLEIISGRVHYKVSILLSGKDGAEDVSQEVLLRVCKGIGSLQTPKAFMSWLNRIVINEKNRYLESHYKRGILLDVDDCMEDLIESNDEKLPSESLHNDEMRNAIKEIIEQLPARQKEAVLLHYFDDLSTKETAHAMDVTLSCVSQYISLACEKMKIELERRNLAAKDIATSIITCFDRKDAHEKTLDYCTL